MEVGIGDRDICRTFDRKPLAEACPISRGSCSACEIPIEDRIDDVYVGAVINPESRSRLGGRGFVIYLYTSVDQQLSRTNKGRERPLLDNADRRGTLETLLQQRDPLYREIADLVVDTNGRKVNSVAKEIIENIT